MTDIIICARHKCGFCQLEIFFWMMMKISHEKKREEESEKWRCWQQYFMENRLVRLLLLLAAHFYWLTTIDYLSILLEFKCTKLTSGNQTIFNKYDMPHKNVDICNLFALRDMLLSAKKEENNFDCGFNAVHIFYSSFYMTFIRFVTIARSNLNYIQ